MSTLLELQHVSHAYSPGLPVLNQLCLTLNQGEIFCLLGPSGCGKTTALRIIAGFEEVTAGEVRLGDRLVAKPGYTAPPETRRVGMVFQDDALFPHLDIATNIGFGLHRMSEEQRHSRIRQLLQMIGLEEESGKYPHQLSGGQRQRAALARAMAPRPSLILLDEPFSNLDADLRRKLCREVRGLLKKNHMSAVMVTHDQREAFALADRIGIMHAGRLIQVGTAPDLFHRPCDRFVAEFIGEGRLLRGTIAAGAIVQLDTGQTIPAPGLNLPNQTSVDLLVRPENWRHEPKSPWRAKVLDMDFRGAGSLYELELVGGAVIQAYFPASFTAKPGDEVGLRLKIEHVVAFPVA